MDLPPPTAETAAEAPVSDVAAHSLAALVHARCDITQVQVVHVGVQLPVDAQALSWMGQPCLPQPSLRLSYRVGAEARSVPVRPRLELWKAGPVAPQDVAAGQPFVVQAGEIRWREAQGNRLQGRVVSRVPLKAGQAVTPSVARRVPDVTTGDAVDLVLSRGAVRVTAPGELLSTGFVGDRVTVRNRSTRIVHRGQLVDATTVELSP